MMQQSYIMNILPKYIFWTSSTDTLFMDIDNEYIYPAIVCVSKIHNMQYRYFTDMLCADYPNKRHRMLLVYNIFSMLLKRRIIMRTWIFDLSLVTKTITQWFPAASWYEREIFDLFGVHFIGNVDLRRILTDYGFDSHPMRKDYPLVGFVELKYNITNKLLLYDSIKLVQEWRAYTLNQQWVSR